MSDPFFYCEICGEKIYNKTSWCINKCAKKKNFEGWTSGNDEYDKLIKSSWGWANTYKDDVVRWVPWENLQNLVEIVKGDSGVVYGADWLDGRFKDVHFDESGKRVIDWETIRVEVKVMNSGSDAEEEFFREVRFAIILANRFL